MSEWTIAHDFTFAQGGAERVTRDLASVTSGTDMVVIAGSPDVSSSISGGRSVTFLAPGWINEGNYRKALPLHVVLASRARIQGNLLASSYGFAHLIRAAGTKVVYCHSPLRQAWSAVDEYSNNMGGTVGATWRYAGAPWFRSVDRRAVKSVDQFIATSRAVQRRIREYYERDSVIIPPAVDPVFSYSRRPPEYDVEYLWVGRIVEPYKRLSTLLRAFAQVDRRLTVVGDGRDRRALERLAPPNVKFVGSVGSLELSKYYRSARALIMPSEDDFGMVATEAMSTGTPVIALKRGGALDTVSERSGVFIDDDGSDAIVSAVAQFERGKWNREETAAWANRFSLDTFAQRIRETLG